MEEACLFPRQEFHSRLFDMQIPQAQDASKCCFFFFSPLNDLVNATCCRVATPFSITAAAADTIWGRAARLHSELPDQRMKIRFNVFGIIQFEKAFCSLGSCSGGGGGRGGCGSAAFVAGLSAEIPSPQKLIRVRQLLAARID